MESSYPCRVTDDVNEKVKSLRSLLERELDTQLEGYFGCWPLLVGVLGLLLGLALLFESP